MGEYIGDWLTVGELKRLLESVDEQSIVCVETDDDRIRMEKTDVKFDDERFIFNAKAYDEDE